MKTWGPYRREDKWRVKWVTEEGKATTKTHATIELAHAHIAELRGGGPSGAPAKDGPTVKTAAGFADVLDRKEWLSKLAALAMSCLESGDDVLRIARSVTPIFATAFKYLERHEETRRLEELENLVAEMRKAASAGADQRGAVFGAAETARSEPAVH